MAACQKTPYARLQNDLKDIKVTNIRAVTLNLTSIACNAPIRDERPKLVPMAIAFCSVTTLVVGLRFFQRLYLGAGLYSDDYLILLSHVSLLHLCSLLSGQMSNP